MKKYLAVFVFILSVTVQGFTARLFYLSTEKTFTTSEILRIKLESTYMITELKIRVYRIKDPALFYTEQDNIHRPKITGRKFRYFTPDILEDFSHYLELNVRDWSRENIPDDNRNSVLKFLPDLHDKRKTGEIEYDKRLQEIVKLISDDNFQFVKEFTYETTRNNDWNYSYIFLNDLEPGCYLIEGINAGNVAYTVLNISDLGFIVKKADEQLVIYTVNNRSGERLSNIELSVYDSFKRLKDKTKSNANGLAELKANSNELFVIGRNKDNSYAFYDPIFYPVNVRNLYTYIYTERPVYRGGDEVFFKGIIRAYKNDAYTRYSSAKPVSIEVVDGRGTVLQTLNTPLNADSTFNGKIVLSENAAAGRYLLIASIDNKRFESEFKVEYYTKPEFEVTVVPENPLYVSGSKITAKVAAKYYFGEPVTSGKAVYSVYRTRYNDSQWQKVQDKSFYLSEAEFTYSHMELLDEGEAALNESGEAKLYYTAKKETSPYNYIFQVRVLDQNEIGVSGQGSVRVVPSNYRLTISADKFIYLVNEEVKFTVTAGDYENNVIQTTLEVLVSSEQPSGRKVYIDEKVKTGADGSKEMSFKAKDPGFIRITVNGKDPSGNPTETEKYLWIGKDGASYDYKGGLIKLVLDKQYYRVGESAKLLIISPVSDLDYLITQEGDRVYSSEIRKFNQNSSVVMINIKDNYSPNIFIDVNFIFDNQLYSNTIKLTIPPVEKMLNIELKPDLEVFEPKKSGHVKVKVTNYTGKPVADADLSIGVVDEAIYGISQEIAVDIRNFFYPFRRNNVRTWASIGFRFYGYSLDAASELSKLITRDSTGLAAFKESQDKERKEFKDTILWIPNLKTDKNGEADFTVKFPDNITKWRMTAVGVSPDTQVGRNTAFVTTKLLFFSKIARPLVLDEKDQSTLYTTTYNYTAGKLPATVRLLADNLELLSGSSQNIELEPNSYTTLEWQVKPKKPGEATVQLNAVSTDNVYTDSLSATMKVLPHSIMKTIGQNKVLSDQDNKIIFKLPNGMKKNSDRLILNLSYGFYSAIVSAVPYLVQYPYGCVEQTTSSFLPNLVAAKALKKLKINLTEEQKLPDIVNKGLSKLYGYQNPDKTWGWWNNNESDVYMTAYVLYALTLTKEAGYEVNRDVLEKGLNALVNTIAKSRNTTEELYSLYVLSLNNRKYPSMLEKFTKSKKMTDYESALLILTLFNYNKKEQINNLVKELCERAKKGKDSESMYWGTENGYQWHQDNIETTAWVIKALYRFESDQNLISKGLNWLTGKTDYIGLGINYLLTQREGSSWKSTRDTAAVVYALTDVIDRVKFSEKNLTVYVNNTRAGEVQFSKDAFQTDVQFTDPALIRYLNGNNEIKVEKLEKKERLYASFALEYYTDDHFISKTQNGITVERTYYQLRQAKVNEAIKYELGDKLTGAVKNEPFIIELKVQADRNYEYLMIEDYYPAGAVPVKDFLIYNLKNFTKANLPDFTDYRDEKAVFFFDRNVKPVYYIVNPVYTGEYKVLPAQASLMYFPAIRGNSNQDNLSIK